MEYKLVVDSCCEMIPEMQDFDTESAPLSITLDGVNYTDDENLDIDHFISAMRKSKTAPKSACPSPDTFAKKFRKGMNVFAVTLSSKLSGSYNSALLGAKLAKEDCPERRIHVFDSLSASAGEIAVVLKIKECIQQKMDFDSIVSTVTKFIDEMKTFFILETLDTLIKAGRMSKIVGYAASMMSLRPIMGSDNGMIKLGEKARGSVRAFTRLVDIIGENCTNFAERTLVITHCNNERQAHFIKSEAMRRFHFKDVKVASTGGSSTMYANEGGVVIAF